MAPAWALVAWIIQLRRELEEIAPRRDKTSDGTIGDQAHQDSKSGHNPDESGRSERTDADSKNEVRAFDIDADLNVPGLTMQMLVAHLVGRCRAGLERRLIYIIYRGVIWAASSGWEARTYAGSNPHNEHAHLSGHPDGDEDGRPFGLAALMEGTAMTPQQFVKILQDPTVSKLMRALPWQYTGGGIPAGLSTLNVLNTILSGVAADDTDKVVAEIRAQGEQTRRETLAYLQQIAPTLAQAVATELGPEVTATEIGEALAREFAQLLGQAVPAAK